MAKVYLRSGEIVVREDNSILCTVLGSCVSLCVYDPIKRIGGMNHFLLPEPNEVSTYDEPLIFGINAIPALLKEFKNRGSNPADLIIKVLGGACAKSNTTTPVHIENIEMARKLIKRFGLKIQAESVGGSDGRKIEFSTLTGEVRFGFTTLQCQEARSPRSISAIQPAAKIRVMIIDDSAPVRLVLKKMIEEDPQLEVVCECPDASLAENLREQFRPDIMTLDLHMPVLDGLSYLRKIMPFNPIPTILVTDCSLNEGKTVISALEAGAFEYMQKPSFSQMTEAGAKLRAIIYAAYKHLRSGHFKPKTLPLKQQIQEAGGRHVFSNEILQEGLIAIGASTGGTEAIRALLTALPEAIPPIVIVQHMPENFTKNFADRLNELCSFNVHEAYNNEKLVSNTVYIAPGGRHLQVASLNGVLYTKLTELPDDTLFRPSVDVLFQSIARLRVKMSLAVLLTGMGRDGAHGLLELKEHGAITFAQDEESCIVFGMPKAAIDLGAAQFICSLTELPHKMVRATRG